MTATAVARRDAQQKVQFEPNMLPKHRVSVVQAEVDIASCIEEATYYHGLMSGDECGDKLKEMGDYLVRKRLEEITREPLLILSAMTKSGIRHKLIAVRRLGVTLIGDRHFVTVPQMIYWYTHTATAIQKHVEIESIILMRGIVRPGYLLPSHEIKFERRVGKGQYGDVWLGSIPNKLLTNSNATTQHRRTTVALKIALDSGDTARLEMVHEAKRMLNYRHSNIVQCHGIAADKVPLTIVLEYCSNGALDSHLRTAAASNCRPSVLRRLNWARHTSSAMAYLWRSHHGLHRDLATRNVLLDGEFRAKLSDFGLSRHVKETGMVYDMVGAGKMPVRWLAPEVFAGNQQLNSGQSSLRFTTKTDVYSFGILLWEIEHDAALPWGDIANEEVIKRVKHGHRPLITNAETSNDMQLLMHDCWQHRPSGRPTFDRLHDRLAVLCRRHCERLKSQRQNSERTQRSSQSDRK